MPTARKSSSGTAWCSGMWASSTTMLCEPLPLRPIRSPQLSRTRKSLRGTTTTTSRSGSPVGAMPDVVRRVRRARAEVPGAVHAVAAGHRLRERVLEREARGRDEMAVAEDLRLRFLRPVRADLQRMAGAEREHPAGRGAAAGDRHHHAVEGRDVELEAAEARVAAGGGRSRLRESLVQLLRVPRSLLGRRLLLEQPRPERVRLREELVG